MKRSIALSIILTLLATVIFPLQAFAAYDKDLQKAIISTKALFNVSAAYNNFSYNINKQNNTTIFDLTWTDSKGKMGNLNVSVDVYGKITNYGKYKPQNYRNIKKIPAVSKSDAIKFATNFIRKVNPAIINSIRYQENNTQGVVNDTGYYLTFIRVEKGIPFPENMVSVMVDKMTGEVQNYSLNWYEGLTFPDTANTMTVTEAQKQYADKLGLKLVYKQTFNQNEPKPYLVYTNVYSNRYLDAKTGEVVDADSYYGFDGGKAGMGGDGLHSYGKAENLTPKELEAVENAANLLEQNKAEDIARKALELDSAFVLNNANLYKDWQSADDFLWNFDFIKEVKTGNQGSLYTSVAIDGKTGEVRSFYRALPQDSAAKVNFTQEQCLEKARSFITSLQPVKAGQVESTNWNMPIVKPLAETAQVQDYNFEFTRKVNGAYFMDNGFRIGVSNTTGTVTNYNLNWYKKDLPVPESLLTLNQAHELLFKNIGLQAQYVSRYAQPTTKIAPIPDNNRPREIKLVYALKQGQPANLDPSTGKLLDYNGKPYVQPGISQYKDITGSFAESKIKVLGELGIALPGNQLKPNQAITQREFLFLLEKAVNPYFEYDWTAGIQAEDTLYAQLTEQGIIRDGERQPAAKVTKIQAVKFLVRALNYDKVAEISKDIYKLPFKDTQKLKADQYGYLAVAYGLNLVAGDSRGNVQPYAVVNRAVAMVLMYNFLNV